ncbi:helix-turn-helix domain-containing protein [Sphingobium yanoikuyae]|uniref:helix-turn-helix domain-containing protein n=1 Tax=Sphingobium yanoikuyae TaxID=13690 RepID=UPI0035C74735
MSIKIMSQVWEMDLPVREKFVLLAFADAASDEGGCWPLVATIAKKCSMEVRTVRRAVAELEKMGYLKRSKRANHSNIWTIKADLLGSQDSAKSVAGDLP